MKQVFKYLSSARLALVLLLAFAVAMAVATFIENDYGTETAWAIIYDAWWFEMIMVGLGLSFLSNIQKYRLWRKEKWAILLFHLAFIVILIGAGITRYTSDTGIMRIREGASSNVLISDRDYLTVKTSSEGHSQHLQKELTFTPLEKDVFDIKTSFQDKDIRITYNEFYADALPHIIEDSTEGKPLIEMVVSTGQSRETVFLEKGEVQNIGPNHQIGFETAREDIINILEKDGQLSVKSPVMVDFFIMATQVAGTIEADSLKPLDFRTLYRAQDISFVPMHFVPNGRIELTSGVENAKDNDETKDDALLVNVQVQDESKEVALLYRKGFIPTTHEVRFDDVVLELSYGSKPIHLPFALQLNDFQLERYPGSSSPSAYASEVTILDEDQSIPYRIFMNNVLDHRGYRFFQASYDTDEQGTVLSVNYDWWGTMITYLGYLLMTIGMFFSLFGKGSYFAQTNRKLKQLQVRRISVLILISVLSSISLAANNPDADIDGSPANPSHFLSKEHAEKFGTLCVQDLDGRIKPINTLASEFIRKVSRKTYYSYTLNGEKFHLDANQIFLAMHVHPKIWETIPIIKIDARKGGIFFEDLPINKEGFISFQGLLDDVGNYQLAELVEMANDKKPAEQNELDKEVIKVDERFNVVFNVLSGNYLKIFPNRLKNDNDTWYSFNHDFQNFPEEDIAFVQNILSTYFKEVATQNWEAADEQIAYIDTYQKVISEDLIPSKRRIDAELLYNKLNLNFWLFQVFFVLGFLILILAVVKIFLRRKWIDLVWKGLLAIIVLCFIAFAANIGLRWYVAQHAPWSNGYEMLVFVAWVLMLCGLLTYKKSDFTLPLATLFAGTLLFVSYLDWLNPEITNLMPVLKSVWLKIHVAIIVSSYAPFALAAVLGFMALLLMIFRTSKNAIALNPKIKELTHINNLAMTIGLFLLSIGSFLGGVWANESWGRYWAWDPKETWALISMIVYAAVLHLRFIPKLRNDFTLNTAAVFAFASIIMTSFGVNYYLSGLHSYAAGDPLPIPTFIYVVIGVVSLVAILAAVQVKKYNNRRSEEERKDS